MSFVHTATNARYDLAVGSPSILAGQDQMSSDEGTVEPDWDRWNAARENVWAAKATVRGRSVKTSSPRSLQGESYALDENGRWESRPPMKVHGASSGDLPPSLRDGRPSPWAARPNGMETNVEFRMNLSVTSPTITATGFTRGMSGLRRPTGRKGW